MSDIIKDLDEWKPMISMKIQGVTYTILKKGENEWATWYDPPIPPKIWEFGNCISDQLRAIAKGLA